MSQAAKPVVNKKGFLVDNQNPGLNPFYAALPESQGNHCGEWVEININDVLVKAEVVDTLPDSSVIMNVSPAVLAYAGITDIDQGVWNNVSWRLLEGHPPPGDGPWTNFK